MAFAIGVPFVLVDRVVELSTLNVQQQQWTADTSFTLENYQSVLTGQKYTYTLPDGTVKTDQGELAPASLTTMDSPNQVIEVGLATANAPGYTASRPRKRTEHPLRCCRTAPS